MLLIVDKTHFSSPLGRTITRVGPANPLVVVYTYQGTCRGHGTWNMKQLLGHTEQYEVVLTLRGQ